MTAKISPRQRRFVDEFLLDYDAPSAYYRARNATVAHSEAYKLLRHPKVQELIRRATPPVRPRPIEATPDSVIQQAVRIAFADIRDYVTWDEDGMHLRDFDQIDGTGLVEVSETIGNGMRTLTVKLADKGAAIETLARRFGLLRDHVDVNINVPLAKILKMAWKEDPDETVDPDKEES